jgi:Family of unknown function (DUF6166)
MRTYRGQAGPDFPGGPAKIIVTEDDGSTHPLRHVVKHSPMGMNWGYGGSGPADTALSLLVDALNLDPDNVPRNLPYQRFKFALVAGWGQSWVLTQEDIIDWYDQETQEA